MSTHKSTDIKENEDSQFKKWRDAMNVSRLRFYVVSLIFIILGLLFVFAGALTEPIINNVFKSAIWATNLFSIVLPLTGVTILGIIIPQLISRMGKYKSEFDRMRADSEYIAGEVLQKFKMTSFDYLVMKKTENERWCRWRGPISNVFPKRKKDILEEFFKGAKEIDILTPNLWEVFNHAIDSLMNPHAQVRMMSLHPECSAVYRRFNYMGPSEEIKSRADYSDKIRDALEGLHKKRLGNWQIRTYTIYPVIMIFRADDRFLLGFPLGGSRVRDQFHFELLLPSISLDEMKTRIKNKDNDNETEIGAEIYNDLTKHFEKIWTNSKQCIPWMGIAEIFKKVLEIPLPNKSNAYCFHESLSENKPVFRDLIQFIFSLDSFKNHIDSCTSTLSEHQECIEQIIDEVPNLGIKNFKDALNYDDDNAIKKILKNISEVLKNALDATIETLDTLKSKENVNKDEKDKLFANKLVDKLSYGHSREKFGFEDCSEVLWILRKAVMTGGDKVNWKNVWEKIEEIAKSWAR